MSLNYKPAQGHIVYLLSILVCIGNAAAQIPPQEQPLYNDGILAYYEAHYRNSLELANQVLEHSPRDEDAQKLKALSLEAMEDYDGALHVYDDLIGQLKETNTNPSVLAPYWFEQGVLHFKRRKIALARPLFVSAIKFDFNPGASHYFLGCIYFQTKDYERATAHFRLVIRNGPDTLKPSAYYFLGAINSRTNHPASSIAQFRNAQSSANERITTVGNSDSDIALQRSVLKGVDKALEPLQQGAYGAHISLMTIYDSNVITAPIDAAIFSLGPTGLSSFQEMINVGLQYASSPLSSWQVVPSFQATFNYNFNSAVQSQEYLVNDAAIYFTHGAMEETSYGLKIEGIGTLEYLPNSDGSGSTLTPYSLAGSIGPFFRQKLGFNTKMGVDVYVQPQKFYIDSRYAPEINRSGMEPSARVYVKYDEASGFLNPSASLVGRIDSLTGAEFRSNSVEWDLANNLYFGTETSLLTEIDLGLVDYSDRPEGARSDTIAAFGFTLSQRVDRFLLQLGMKYLINGSNVPLYSYNHLIASLGGSISF